VAALFHGDRIVAHAWYRGRSEPNRALRFEVEPGAVWGYDLVVAPECRGRRLAARVLDWAEAALADEGARRIVSTIDVYNVPSLRVAARRGATRLGTVLVVRVAGLTVRREAWARRRPRWSVDRGAGVVPVPRAGGARQVRGSALSRTRVASMSKVVEPPTS
jgi:RimJ/RimL family protein N-acetyltransferase